MVRHPISSALCILTASVVLCFPLTLASAPAQMEDSIIISASGAIVTGMLK